MYRDGNLWVVVIVKSCVNKQAGSCLASQEWKTNQKPGQQVDPILDMTATHKFPLQILTFLFPAGLYFCFSKLSDHNIFIILYGVFAVYFAGVMVRSAS